MAYVITALYVFDGKIPIYSRLLGMTNDINQAFSLIHEYNYKKEVNVDGEYDLAGDKTVRQREFGIDKITKKAFYAEIWDIGYKENLYPTNVAEITFTIYEV